MTNPITFWRDWWAGNSVLEKAVVIVTLVTAIAVLIATQALAADTDSSQINNIWTVLIVAVVTGTLSPALLMYMKNQSDSKQRTEDAEYKRQERLATEAREDAREARADAQRAIVISDLAIVKKQSDGVIEKITELAGAKGHAEGAKEATTKAEDKAATLATGQQQGRDAERESVASKAKLDSDKPLPVFDKITNETGERAAEALESMARNSKVVGAEEKKTP